MTIITFSVKAKKVSEAKVISLNTNRSTLVPVKKEAAKVIVMFPACEKQRA